MNWKKISIILLVIVVIVSVIFFWTTKKQNSTSMTYKIEQPEQPKSNESVLSTVMTYSLYVLLIINIIFLPYLIRELAENNILLTFAREGEAKPIMGSGDSGFQKFLFQYRGHYLDKEWNVIEESGDNNNKTKNKFLSLINFFGLSGVKYLGIPFMQTLHTYTFRWNSLRQTADSTTQDNGGIYFTPHDEQLQHILLQQDIYYARVEGAEDNKMVPLNLDATIKVKIVNPYKALFRVQEWLEMVWGLVIPALRRYASTQDWEILVKNRAEKGSEYYEMLKSEGTIRDIKDNYGVDIMEFQFIRISPAGERAIMYEEAATKEYIATQEAKRIQILAAAEKNRIKTVYGQIEEHAELGQLIRRLEALEKAAEGQSNTILSFPDLAAISTQIADTVKKTMAHGG